MSMSLEYKNVEKNIRMTKNTNLIGNIHESNYNIKTRRVS